MALPLGFTAGQQWQSGNAGVFTARPYAAIDRTDPDVIIVRPTTATSPDDLAFAVYRLDEIPVSPNWLQLQSSCVDANYGVAAYNFAYSVNGRWEPVYWDRTTDPFLNLRMAGTDWRSTLDTCYIVLFCYYPATLTIRNLELGALGTVQSLSATDGEYADKVVVTWNGDPSADGYELEYKEHASDTWSLLARIEGNTSFEHTLSLPVGKECAYNQQYDYRVFGYKQSLRGDQPSNDDSGFRILNNVTGVQASDGMWANKITIDWDQAPGANGYALEYRNLSGGTPASWTELAKVIGGQITHFEHTSTAPAGKEASPEQPYDYRCKALLGGFESPDWSMIDEGSTSLGPGDWWMFGHDPQHTRRSPFVGAQTPALKWKYLTTSYVTSSPAIAADGTVYIASCDSKLYAIKPDGSLKWVYATNDRVESSPAIGADGTVYIGSSDFVLYAINPDGSLKWSYKTGYLVESSPAIGVDGTIYIGSYDNNLYAIGQLGTRSWSFTTGSYLHSSPAIGIDGTLYIGGSGNLYAIKPDGTLRWNCPLGDAMWSSPAIGTDGTVYIGSLDNNIYSVKADGTLKWEYPTGGDILSSPAIAADGTVYVGSYDNNVYAINPDGTLKWSYATGGDVESSPAIGADGTVYVGSDYNFYALNSNGTLKWSYPTAGAVASSPAIGANGAVYVGSVDGYLYAFADQ